MSNIRIQYIPTTLRLKINSIVTKYKKRPEAQVQCPVCGSWKGKLDSCCDESDNRPVRDDDDVRTWEADYD